MLVREEICGVKDPELCGLNGVTTIQNFFMLRLAKEDEEIGLRVFKMTVGSGRRTRRIWKV